MRRVALLLAILAAAGCKPRTQPAPAAGPRPRPKVTVLEARPRTMEYAVEATGSIEAAEEISIPARVSGIIDQVTFREGDAVEEKSVLVEIEVDKFKLGEERAQAELDRARATATLAETVFKNRFALYEEGRRQKKDWVTEEQMATWKADLDKAKADLERARVDLELARRSHRDARIRPPMAGVINRKLVSKGEFVKPETIVATILNVGTLHVRFTVPELEASRLSHGQEIAFSIRSAPGRTFKARLFYLSQKADPVTRAVECKAEVREPGAALRAGTYAQVRIVTGTENSIAVPERAVLHTEKGFGAFVVEGGVARARSLKLGLRVDGQVEVLEGLREGERVVVDGALTLREGLEVEVVEPAGRPPAREAAGGGGP